MRTAILLALALCGLAARAQARPSLVLTAHSFRSGECVAIAWTDPGPRVHEVELELSLAGGGWTRISPELEARQRGYFWRVPHALTGDARLRLRWGGDGFEAAGEPVTIRLVSAWTGTIAWTGDDPFAHPCSGGSRGAFSSGARVIRAAQVIHAIAATSFGLRAPVRCELPAAPAFTACATAGPPASGRATAPRVLPLRI